MQRVIGWALTTAFFVLPCLSQAAEITWTWTEDSAFNRFDGGPAPRGVNFGPIQFTIDRPVNISFCSDPFFFSPCATRFPATPLGGIAPLPPGLESFSLGNEPLRGPVPFPIPSLFEFDAPSFGMNLVANDTNINIQYELNTTFNSDQVHINNDMVRWASDFTGCDCGFTGHWTVAVPEPPTLAILLTALAFLGFCGWHVRRRSTHHARSAIT